VLPAGAWHVSVRARGISPSTELGDVVVAADKDNFGRSLARTFSWVVAVGPSVTAPATQNGTTGTAITNLTVTATGGTSPYTWTATGLRTPDPAGEDVEPRQPGQSR
jgi:hypothetical protein